MRRLSAYLPHLVLLISWLFMVLGVFGALGILQYSDLSIDIDNSLPPQQPDISFVPNEVFSISHLGVYPWSSSDDKNVYIVKPDEEELVLFLDENKKVELKVEFDRIRGGQHWAQTEMRFSTEGVFNKNIVPTTEKNTEIDWGDKIANRGGWFDPSFEVVLPLESEHVHQWLTATATVGIVRPVGVKSGQFRNGFIHRSRQFKLFIASQEDIQAYSMYDRYKTAMLKYNNSYNFSSKYPRISKFLLNYGDISFVVSLLLGLSSMPIGSPIIKRLNSRNKEELSNNKRHKQT